MKYPNLNTKQIEELKDIINNNSSSNREIKRSQTILILDKKKGIKDIFEIIGLSRSQIFNLRNKYFKQGIEAIKDKRKKNPKELLIKKQRNEIIEILKTKTPRNYGYNDDYWTTPILGDFIKRKYNVQYKSKTSFYIIFKQAKFSYRKPSRVYHLRDEKEVQEWEKTNKPVLEKALKQENTVVLVEDEMILSTQTTLQKIWLLQGENPKIEVSNKKENRSIYGFLNIKTGQEHSFKMNWQNMFITCDILKKLRNIYPTEKLLLFWDGAGWHRGSEVQKFIQEDKNIETIYFPKYAPDLNPQEHVWKNGRSKITHNKFIQNIDIITDEFINYLNSAKFNYSLLGFNSQVHY